MPELAEVRLTSDYVNNVVEGKIFTGITKNPDHKWREVNFGAPFLISSRTKGKELMLTLKTPDSYTQDLEKNLMMTMGMGGHFKWFEHGEGIRNTHLFFHSECGGHLAFVDVRRFGKWNWGDWNQNRGPDPTTDWLLFCQNVWHNLEKPTFNKPIYEVLMDQRYFNGIGNYLRSEILYRIGEERGANPFLSGKEYMDLYGWEVLTLCRDIPLHVYEIGGGSIKDWKNPFGKSSNVKDFLLCYGNNKMKKILDKNDRTFWYDPKWEN